MMMRLSTTDPDLLIKESVALRKEMRGAVENLTKFAAKFQTQVDRLAGQMRPPGDDDDDQEGARRHDDG